ncbi:hypothetical protein TrCOL_g2051 [Triparma columacea]|uniref:Uncharacterized protein n=1 Tax=Triparma columacea TaxID=722753 RepID=A0A9W7GMU3_9STRA|nr:hypothetical protein TrCOL_g2051 [Triparma columacea]
MFKQSSRRYCKQQMQWWRKKPGVCWVEMDGRQASVIQSMNSLPRYEWDNAVEDEEGESERVKKMNEEQGKGMKRFQSKAEWEEGELIRIWEERDYWRKEIMGKIDRGELG